jgi:hypothetical protein
MPAASAAFVASSPAEAPPGCKNQTAAAAAMAKLPPAIIIHFLLLFSTFYHSLRIQLPCRSFVHLSTIVTDGVNFN